MKRTVDFTIALAALLILAAPLAAIALAIFLEDRSSPFYRGVRIGKDQKPFRMLKFRSMHVDAWKSGVNSTAAGDSRITRTGGWLRRFKLDELPQMWNVLVGQMSLVGPRPQVPLDAGLYTETERRILDVRPGITDLASIVFADEAEILAGAADPDLKYNRFIRPWKSRLALAYLDHESLALDTRILVFTVLAAVSRPQALRRIAALLCSWGSDPLLIQMALRESPLLAWPPPGADQVVSCYPRAEAARA